ncbi:hypothetical protein FY049_02620 [Acinetobacter sp. 1125_18A]
MEILNDIVKYIDINSIVNYDSFIFEYKFNPDEGWANFHLDYCKDNQSYLASIQDFGFSTLEDLSKKLHDEMQSHIGGDWRKFNLILDENGKAHTKFIYNEKS